MESIAVSDGIKHYHGSGNLACLVHNGVKVVMLTGQAKNVWTSASNTMLVGTLEELNAEIERLSLTR